jgi:hypothetical protein
MSVHKKLMAARLALQAVKLKKSGLNKFAGYSYFELGDFIPTVQSIFADAGLCGVIGYGKELATLTITDTDDMTSLEITSPMSSAALKGCHEVQNLGAVETYIRRYLWVTAMEIVEHDALEATTGRDKPEAKKESAIPASFRSSPTMGAMDDIPADEQEYMRELAIEVIALIAIDQGSNAYRRVESEQLDDSQKTALWSILDSKTRSAIKKAGQIMKATA